MQRTTTQNSQRRPQSTGHFEVFLIEFEPIARAKWLVGRVACNTFAHTTPQGTLPRCMLMLLPAKEGVTRVCTPRLISWSFYRNNLLSLQAAFPTPRRKILTNNPPTSPNRRRTRKQKIVAITKIH